MHFVGIGHRTVALRKIADPIDGSHIAIHGIERLEDDELRPARLCGLEQFLQVIGIVMIEYPLFGTGLAHALDHRIVIPGVRKDQAVRHQFDQGRDTGFVRHIARREDECRILAVEIGQFVLKINQRMVGARDVARAACTGAHSGRGFDHRANDLGVLSHPEVIVGAPHHDIAGTLRRVPDRAREASGQPFEVGKNPIPPLIP